jgi:hypothetical protein
MFTAGKDRFQFLSSIKAEVQSPKQELGVTKDTMTGKMARPGLKMTDGINYINETERKYFDSDLFNDTVRKIKLNNRYDQNPD